MNREQRILIEEQVTACGMCDLVLRSDWRGKGGRAARADAASDALRMLNEAIRRLVAYRATGKSPLPEIPPPFDRMSMLQETRRNVLGCL